MSVLYEESHRRLQRQFETERLADRIEQRLFRRASTDEDRAFIERARDVLPHSDPARSES